MLSSDRLKRSENENLSIKDYHDELIRRKSRLQKELKNNKFNTLDNNNRSISSNDYVNVNKKFEITNELFYFIL